MMLVPREKKEQLQVFGFNYQEFYVFAFEANKLQLNSNLQQDLSGVIFSGEPLPSYQSGYGEALYPSIPVDFTIEILFSLEQFNLNYINRQPFIYMNRVFAIRFNRNSDSYGLLQVAHNGRWRYYTIFRFNLETEKRYHLLRWEFRFRSYQMLYLDNSKWSGFTRYARQLINSYFDRVIHLFKPHTPFPIYMVSIAPTVKLVSYQDRKRQLEQLFNIEIV